MAERREKLNLSTRTKLRNISVAILRRTLDGTHGSIVPFETQHDRRVAYMVWTDIAKEFAFALSDSQVTRDEFLEAVITQKKGDNH
jgi:hypothetical protein